MDGASTSAPAKKVEVDVDADADAEALLGFDAETVEHVKHPLERFLLYETKAKFYLIGYTRCRRYWRLMHIDRSPVPSTCPEDPAQNYGQPNGDGMPGAPSTTGNTRGCGDDGQSSSKRRSLDPSIVEDPCTYSEKEIGQVLWRLKSGNEHHGGLRLVKKAYGIVGFVQFVKGNYLILITKRKRVGMLFSHRIYAICGTACIPIEVETSPSGIGGFIPKMTMEKGNSISADEKRYFRLFMGVDLCKDFFFSYTYPLWNSLQRNLSSCSNRRSSGGSGKVQRDGGDCAFDSMFVWNAFLATEYCPGICYSDWIVPLIHGFFDQVTLSTFGRSITLSLIARRSRYFAGTRFLKRGINDLGQVANEVETEQIVDAGRIGGKDSGCNSMSSVVQVRGSIPLYWSQETNPLNPKPEIVLQRYDPSYLATKRHFDSLVKRYGNPLIILNLIKSVERRPREMILRVEFAQAVEYLNKFHYKKDLEKLLFVHWDFSKSTKQRGVNVLAAIRPVVTEALANTGIFYAIPTPHRNRRATQTKKVADVTKQQGILRTNCIDCLDRTNVAQFAYGLFSLEHQLFHLGMIDTKKIDVRSEIATQLMNLYESMGDCIALQYGGSEAHSVFFKRQKGTWEATTQSKDLMTSFRRFYNNTYTDAAKQAAINLFLGHFVPRESRAHIWDLDSDYYLPNLYYQREHDLAAAKKTSEAEEKASGPAIRIDDDDDNGNGNKNDDDNDNDSGNGAGDEDVFLERNLRTLCQRDANYELGLRYMYSSFDKMLQKGPKTVNVRFCDLSAVDSLNSQLPSSTESSPTSSMYLQGSKASNSMQNISIRSSGEDAFKSRRSMWSSWNLNLDSKQSFLNLSYSDDDEENADSNVAYDFGSGTIEDNLLAQALNLPSNAGTLFSDQGQGRCNLYDAFRAEPDQESIDVYDKYVNSTGLDIVVNPDEASNGDAEGTRHQNFGDGIFASLFETDLASESCSVPSLSDLLIPSAP